MRAEEVADLLAIKTSTVYELSRRRRDPLPSVRIGRSKRFDRRAVALWVVAHAT
jgi:excisionase family DNA binding protein